MKRREFLALGAAATVGTATFSDPAAVSMGSAYASSMAAAPAILSGYTAADHRRRLENVGLCEHRVRTCLRKHLITGYLPGQCCYNLGEYPCQKPWDPDDWDQRELDRLRDQGIKLIQVHEEWCDSQRLFGAHKLSALNPAGLRRFAEMVHRRGMKLLVYVSSGYFERNDPDFRPEWSSPGDLVELYYHYAHCSPASPGWRAYFLSRLARILDDYGVDGIYNDLGYAQPGGDPRSAAHDEVLAFEESRSHDGALADLLGIIYGEVKRRGGIVKVHRGGASCPHTDLKVYDYLWVGEGGKDGDVLRNAAKNHLPYVVPCLDMSRAKVDCEDDLYLHAIPYMQFPLLLAGRPFTGQRALVLGIKYQPEEKCFWTRHCRAIWKYYQTHPEGPYSYGWWDSVPGRPEARRTHAKWLRLYGPLVEEGTWAWLEVADSDLFARPRPPDVVASVFANRHLHLVLANYGRTAVEIETADSYVPVADASTPPKKLWKVKGRGLEILQRVT